MHSTTAGELDRCILSRAHPLPTPIEQRQQAKATQNQWMSGVNAARLGMYSIYSSSMCKFLNRRAYNTSIMHGLSVYLSVCLSKPSPVYSAATSSWKRICTPRLGDRCRELAAYACMGQRGAMAQAWKPEKSSAVSSLDLSGSLASQPEHDMTLAEWKKSGNSQRLPSLS